MNYEMFLGIGFLATLAWAVVKDAIAQRRVDKLLNRIMAKHYEEFKYYEEKYPEDLKELQTMRAESRVEQKEVVEHELFENDEIDLAQFEEDWAASELDQSKLPAKERTG